jgi:alpha/beta superfamily hydrolase
MANPQQSVAPAQTIALTLDWLERGPDPELEPGVTPSVQRDTVRCGFGDAQLTETPLWLEGLHGRIFGVLTEPPTGSAAPVGAVLVGAGAVPHTGPNRSWVTLARRWAAKGVPTLRVDLGGIGESDGEDPELLTDESFNDRTRGTEIGMVLDQLQRRGVADRFILGGLCSGAYISQRLAREDDRIRGLMLINMYAFEWSMQLMIERDRWDRLSEELPAGRVRSIDRELLRRALRHARPDRAWRLISRASERQQRHEATRALDALRDRGVETLLVLSRDEPLLNQFQRQGLVSRLSRWPNLTLHEGRSRDHMYRALWYQREIYAAMDAALQRMLDRPANAPR